MYGYKDERVVINSIYVNQLRAVLRYHKPEDVMLVASEDVREPFFAQTAVELALFAAPPALTPEREQAVVGAQWKLWAGTFTRTYEPMLPETQKMLEKFFAPYNRELYGLLGRDLGW